MAGQIIVCQRKITLNYSDLPGGGIYEYVHMPSIALPHAREIVLNARLVQRTIAGTGTVNVIVRGHYPDADDANDIVGADLITLTLATVPVSVPGIATGSLAAAIPPHVRVLTKFTQGGSPAALIVTLSVTLVARE